MNKKLLRVLSLMCGAGLLLSVGCAGTGVNRVSTDRERPLTTEFDPDDARQTVETMVDSMMTFPPVLQILAEKRPVLDVTSVKNATYQQIDTKSLTDSIRTRLIRSGKFRFKDRSTSDEDIDIINEENELGLVNPDKAVKPGSQIATEMVLNGRIVEIKAERGRIKDVYYKITMTLKDLRSGEIVWTDEKELRKERKKRVLGF